MELPRLVSSMIWYNNEVLHVEEVTLDSLLCHELFCTDDRGRLVVVSTEVEKLLHFSIDLHNPYQKI